MVEQNGAAAGCINSAPVSTVKHTEELVDDRGIYDHRSDGPGPALAIDTAAICARKAAAADPVVVDRTLRNVKRSAQAVYASAAHNRVILRDRAVRYLQVRVDGRDPGSAGAGNVG